MPQRTVATPEQARQLLVAGQAGDSAAAGQLMDLFRNYLLAVACEEIPEELRAKANPSDIVQDTFLEAFRILGQFEGSQADGFRGWLRGILHNKLRELQNHYGTALKRQVGREQPLDPSNVGGLRADIIAAADSTPSAAAARNEESELLSGAIARLPEDYRLVIVWRTYERVSFVEIGRRLHRSEDAARMLYGRALERLQEEMGSHDAPQRPDGTY
jgi:RNA polymerase sigma-70 factor (ECF subfamily)